MKFSYFIPTKICFGAGMLDRLADEPLPGKKALVVISAGTSMKRFGYLDRLLAILDRRGIGHTVYAKILPNPVKAHVMEGAALAKSVGCDFVIGLGGGSSIDSAKAIAVMVSNPGDYWDYILAGTGGKKPLAADPLPIVAVPTTAGTGTEADPWAVVTNEQTREKIGYGNDRTFPVLSVVDPTLMCSVPPAMTAYQGFDALFHSTEGYIANVATPLSDLYALKSISLIAANLQKCVEHPDDLGARTCVALASTLSGLVESTSHCTSEHSMEHALSAMHPALPHGAGLIILSRAYYDFYAPKASKRFADMADAMGEESGDFTAALSRLEESCGVGDLKMSDYGILREEIPFLASVARKTMGGLFGFDPVMQTEEETVEIMSRAYR